MNTTPLGLKEAGPLAYPLVHRVLADHGIRALSLKGSVAAAQRLRPTRTSNDVDVLCDASAMAAAEHLLDGLGWFRYSCAETDMMAIGMHATTFCIPGWPCTVDVHSHFPGLLAAPQDAFDYLWRRRVPVVLAHQAVPAPAPEDHLIVLWLHLLRGLRPDQEEGARAQFALGWKALTPEQQEHAVASARALGALEPLRGSLLALGAEPGPLDLRFADALYRWELGRRFPGNAGVVWSARWQTATLRQRPELVWRAFWDIEMDRSRTPEEWSTVSARERALGRLRRAGRGVRALPAAVRAARRST